MKRLSILAIATVLALTGCSAKSTNQTPSEASTVTVTTSSQDPSEDLSRKVKSVSPAFSITPENMRQKCAFAIGDMLPSTWKDVDLPDPLDFSDSEGRKGADGVLKQAFIASGEFRWLDGAGAWNDATFTCTVFAEDGGISKVEANVF